MEKNFFSKCRLVYAFPLLCVGIVGGALASSACAATDSLLEGAVYGHPVSPETHHVVPHHSPVPAKQKKASQPNVRPEKVSDISDKQAPPKLVSLPPPPNGDASFKPYFAALRGSKVYMRRGPGVNYPIDWVYYRRGLPVKVSREFQNWCQVEDNFGEKGWMHQATLRSSRNFVVVPSSKMKEELHFSATDSKINKVDLSKQYDAHVVSYCASFDKRCAFQTFPIYSAPDSRDRPVALLLPGAVGRVVKCGGEWKNWCQVNVAGYKGWIERSHLWGALDEDLALK
ncbi:hypothetical protein FAI41_09005 [Acetobacteraceae bacterium]|nr:hypothetical protein FAI41_09005 [Acetobacteraceae bacterium]